MGFGNSFVSGLDKGEDAYYKYQELQRQRAADARAQTLFDQGQEDRTRSKGIERANDEDMAYLNNPNNGLYKLGTKPSAPAPAGEGYGLAPPQTTGLRAPAGGLGADTTPAPVGMTGRAAPVDLDKTPVRGALSRAESEDVYGRVARRKGDVTAARAADEAGRSARYDEAYAEHTKTFNKMPDAEKGALIEKLSLDSSVKGFGNWVPGKGKMAGYMNYMPPNGDPVKLSANEAAQLYALTNLMEVDPARARKELESASDKLRVVAQAVFAEQTKAVGVNNTAVHYANTDDLSKQSLAMRGRELQDSRKARDAANWAPIGVSSDGKGLTVYNRETHETKVQPLPPGTDAAGLFRKLTGAGAGFEKLPEDGTKVKDGRGNVLTYTEGVPLLPGGIPPSQQAKAIQKLGLPPSAEQQIQWLPGGRHFTIQGSESVFDVSNPKDVSEAGSLISGANRRSVEGAEALAAGQGVMDPRDRAARNGPTRIDRYAIPSVLDTALQRNQGR
jgi:hypothetical protein